ncbi:hypothetical protein SLEP1_g27796 [Rubroshorea leprosula]|nr:hypothetical protein SLEP1_g27796 [Rubroshorea leprosula]
MEFDLNDRRSIRFVFVLLSSLSLSPGRELCSSMLMSQIIMTVDLYSNNHENFSGNPGLLCLAA